MGVKYEVQLLILIKIQDEKEAPDYFHTYVVQKQKKKLNKKLRVTLIYKNL